MAILVPVSLLIATAVPLVVLYVIYTLDLYKIGAFRLILMSFVWGTIAFALAAQINTLMVDAELVTYEQFTRFSAPTIEEILKGIILFILVQRPKFTYFVDGAIYGFAAGIGFAIVENYSYVLGLDNQSAALAVAIGRVISTNLIHASASGMVGIAMGLARFERFSGRALYLLAGLAGGMLIHIGFNNLVASELGGLLIVYAAVAGLGGTGLIVAAIRRGLKEEKAWIEAKLGMADRVTAGETAVVLKMEDLDDVLAPVAEIFPDKISQIKAFLLLQAQLGIKRKTLEKLADEKMAQAVREEMDGLRAQMDEARRSVGYGAMIYVRGIFPEGASPLWGRLGTLIDERAASPSGMDLWGDLTDRLADASASAKLDS